MKYFTIFTCLYISGCKLKMQVDNRTDKQIEQDERKQSNESQFKYCDKKCEPYKALAIIVNDYRCICGEVTK